jgi:choline/glycine/proline betaine transport protein
MFIARISRGRTIRGFVAGVLLVPTLVTFIWLVIFGNTALHIELFGEGGIAKIVADTEKLPTALFVLLYDLPLSMVTSALAVIVVATFFVTSSDSASLVIDTLTSDGSLHPPVWQRIFWAVTEGVVAAVLLLAGGLAALQTAAITTALPFAVVILFMCWSLVRGLRAETRAPLPALALGPDAELDAADAPDEQKPWQEQLQAIVGRQPVTQEEEQAVAAARQSMRQFVDETVMPAFRSLRRELQKVGREAAIETHRYHAVLIVARDGKQEFRYAVRTRAYRPAHVAFPELEGEDTPRILRAEIVTGGGAHRDYPLEQFSRDGIIHDFLHEYAKWMGW